MLGLLCRQPLFEKSAVSLSINKLSALLVIDLEVVSASSELVNQVLPRTTPYRFLAELVDDCGLCR